MHEKFVLLLISIALDLDVHFTQVWLRHVLRSFLSTEKYTEFLLCGNRPQIHILRWQKKTLVRYCKHLRHDHYKRSTIISVKPDIEHSKSTLAVY